MPIRFWKHTCCRTYSSGSPHCRQCGQTAHESSWGLSMHEAMARYQLHSGLKPTGAHRPLADRLLNEQTRLCVGCEGTGLIESEDSADWRVCATCSGFGLLPFPNSPGIRAVRAEVLHLYPDALVPGADGVHPDALRDLLQAGAVFAHDLQNGRMIYRGDDRIVLPGSSWHFLRHGAIALRHLKTYVCACVWIAAGPCLLWQGRWLEATCFTAGAVGAVAVLCMEHGVARERPWGRIAVGSGLLMALALAALFVRDVVRR